MAIQQAYSTNDDVWLGRVVAVAGQVAAGLPAGSPPGWSRIAYRTVLSGVLRDWVDNGDTTLEGEDVATLTRFVQQAASAAGSAPSEFRDETFEVVLGALMDDWVINWGGESLEDDEVAGDDDVEGED